MEALRKAIDKDEITKYGKLKGWDICNSLGLPSFGDVYILSDYIDTTNPNIRQIFGEEPLLCRTDAPIGQGYKLIRGRDVRLDDINDYLREVKECTQEGVILMSKHPSTMLTGHYTPRYKTNGAIMVVFERGDKILIDYVGPGFDVGDITRGKTIHTAMEIPWDNIYDKPIHNYKDSKMINGNSFQISDKQYKISRENRIKELTKNLKEKDSIEIVKSIPMQTPKLSYKMFEKLYQECIDKILYSGIRNNNKPYGIMMNIYEDKFCVFEVWNIERSLTKDIELDR